VPIHPNGDSQIEMAKRAIGKFRFHKPAIGAGALQETRAHSDDLAAEKARGIDQMRAMREHEILLEIGLGIA
jgi:hypothetical protein